MHNDDTKAVNTEDRPDNVCPVGGQCGRIDSGKASVNILPLSWNVIRFFLPRS